MHSFGPHNAVWNGDGEWIAFDDFGDTDPDEPQLALLPVLEWQADMQRRYPRAALPVIRQFVRLARAAGEYVETTGRHLNVYGALGELYGALAWGIRLHRKENAMGSDERLGNDFVEIKTIGPRSTTDRVQVKLSGNFNKLLVVKIVESHDCEVPGGFRIAGRMVDRRDLTNSRSGRAGIAWSRACRVGEQSPKC